MRRSALRPLPPPRSRSCILLESTCSVARSNATSRVPEACPRRLGNVRFEPSAGRHRRYPARSRDRGCRGAPLPAADGNEVILVTALATDAAGTWLAAALDRSGVEVVDLGLRGTTREKI